MPIPTAVGTIASGASAGGGFLSSLGGLSGVGNFLSGFGGAVSSLFGGKQKRGPGPEDLMATQLKYEDKSFERLWERAKRFGIHPLAMMGAPSSGGGISFSGNSPSDPSFGERLGQAGVDIGRAMSAGLTSTEKLQERLLLAQIQGQEIDNISRASMLARSQQPGNPPVGSSLNDRLAGMVHNKLGMADGVVPLSRIAVDEGGTPLRVYNDDLGDNEVMMGVHALRYTLPDYLHGKVVAPMSDFVRDVFTVRNPYRK